MQDVHLLVHLSNFNYGYISEYARMQSEMNNMRYN